LYTCTVVNMDLS